MAVNVLPQVTKPTPAILIGESGRQFCWHKEHFQPHFVEVETTQVHTVSNRKILFARFKEDLVISFTWGGYPFRPKFWKNFCYRRTVVELAANIPPSLNGTNSDTENGVRSIKEIYTLYDASFCPLFFRLFLGGAVEASESVADELSTIGSSSLTASSSILQG